MGKEVISVVSFLKKGNQETYEQNTKYQTEHRKETAETQSKRERLLPPPAPDPETVMSEKV